MFINGNTKIKSNWPSKTTINNLPMIVLVQCQMDTGHKKQVTNGCVRISANIACVGHVLAPVFDDAGRKSWLHVDSACRQA